MGCGPSLQAGGGGGGKEEAEEEIIPTANHHTHNQDEGQGQHITPAWDTARQPLRLVTDGAPHLGTVNALQRKLRVLLVFNREDGVCQAWRTALSRQGHHHTLAHSLTDAQSDLKLAPPDIIIIDARTNRGFDPCELCGSLRQVEGAEGAVVVGVVKKSFAERDRATVGPMLKAGFDRVIAESSSVGAVLNDLIQMQHNEVTGHTQVKASQAVLSALDACREVVHITDTHHRIKFINKACENVLGYTLEEVADRYLWDIHTAEVNRQDYHRQGDHHRPSLDHRQPSHSSQTPTDRPGRESEKLQYDIAEAVNQQLRRGKEWEGVVSCRRRSGGAIHLPSKIIPVPPLSRASEYLVYLSDTHLLDRMDLASTVEHFHPRGSIKSLRKGSHDIRSLGSDGPQGIIRRQSLVKLHSVTIEAPISRVFSIITAAQENSPAYVAQALEKAVEILRSTELYSPQLVSSTGNPGDASGMTSGLVGVAGSRGLVSAADPVATDLLGGLLAQGPKPLLSARRSSNDTAVKATQQLPRPSLPALHQQASTAIKELLADDMAWNFDIFKLEKISDKRPLVWLGMSLMCRYDVPDTLGCDESTLQNWLTLIEANYHSENTYHNSTHAADVLQSTAYFLSKDRISRLLDPLDVAACLVAAVVHDVDHPGKNSAFLCNTNNELAILYNDLSVLESHHVAVSFKHTRSDDRVNIFKALDRDTYKYIRKSIVDMVLATDMTKHFEHLSKFVNMAANTTTAAAAAAAATDDDDDDDEAVFEDDPAVNQGDLLSFGSPENVVIIKRMLIKCADVSNPLRPLPLSIDWAYRIANEYFNQTEEEKKRELPIVMPQFDRTTCSIPKSQIGFIDFFINDMFDAWDALADIPELLDHLRSNYIHWKEEEERGSTQPNPAPPPPPPSPPLSPQDEEIKEEEEEEEEGEEGLVLNVTAAAS